MTREEAIKTLKENYCTMCAYGSQNMDSCDIRNCDNKDAIKALEQEPCEDCIDRQRAIRLVKAACNPYGKPTKEIIKILKQIPPATHTQKFETVTEFADRCRECGAKYGKLLKEKSDVVTKERLYERLNDAIRQSEILIVKEEARLDALRHTKRNLDEYFEDLESEDNE